jgi:hypothetical protein
MGIDERSRAADSLSSVLAVYDGFCNLKQVRPSQCLYSTHTRNHLIPPPVQSSTLHYVRAILCCLCSMAVVQSRDLFLVFGSEIPPIKSWSSYSKSPHLPYHYIRLSAPVRYI